VRDTESITGHVEGYIADAEGNRGPLLVTQFGVDRQIRTVRTDRPARLPNLHWHLTHFNCPHAHRWQTDEEYQRMQGGEGPRLIWYLRRETRHVPCDGACGEPGPDGCGGWDVPYWVCPVTGEEIEPGTVAGPSHATYVESEVMTLTVQAEGEPLPEVIPAGHRLEWDAPAGLHFMTLADMRRGSVETVYEGTGQRQTAEYAGVLHRD
jgi:hypothetical protein